MQERKCGIEGCPGKVRYEYKPVFAAVPEKAEPDRIEVWLTCDNVAEPHTCKYEFQKKG